MSFRPSPPYPSEAELKATKAPAIVAFLIIVATIITLVVLLTLEISGAAVFPGYFYFGVFFTGLLLLILTLTVGARKTKRRPTGHPPTTAVPVLSSLDEADQIRDEIHHRKDTTWPENR